MAGLECNTVAITIMNDVATTTTAAATVTTTTTTHNEQQNVIDRKSNSRNKTITTTTITFVILAINVVEVALCTRWLHRPSHPSVKVGIKTVLDLLDVLCYAEACKFQVVAPAYINSWNWIL